MSDVEESHDDPGDPSDIADFLYTAVGFAVLGLQRLQYARRQLEKDAAARLRAASPETRVEVSKFVDAVDAALEKVRAEVPPPIAEVVTVTLSAGRHLREQILDPWIRSPPTATATDT